MKGQIKPKVEATVCKWWQKHLWGKWKKTVKYWDRDYNNPHQIPNKYRMERVCTRCGEIESKYIHV